MTIEDAIKNRERCLEYLEGLGPMATPENVEAVRWSLKALRAYAEKPPCYQEEKDNPHPLCIGRGFANCAHCCLWTGFGEDQDESRVNPPLTLDQLRGMSGEPVWCQSEHRPEAAGWFIVCATAHQPHEFLLVGRERGIPCAGIETGYWSAYRRKPKEAQHEAD